LSGAKANGLCAARSFPKRNEEADVRPPTAANPKGERSEQSHPLRVTMQSSGKRLRVAGKETWAKIKLLCEEIACVAGD